jgi:hypothetical protein
MIRFIKVMYKNLVDKADIYSTEETGTRHLDRTQEKPVEKVEDKQKGSWRIKEGGGGGET